MVDTDVDFFLRTLKNLITSSDLNFMVDEKGKRQLLSLEEELKYLRMFLKITEKKRKEHLEVMNLVMRIIDTVSEVENIVEWLVSHAFKADASPVHEYQDHHAHNIKRLQKEIKNLTDEVKHILNENMYDINGVEVKEHKHSIRNRGSLRRRNTTKVEEEKVVVGFEEEMRKLMEKLHNSGEGEPLEIISIIGAGGGGKTTLAREMYTQRLTLETYEIRAWVVISQDYDRTMKRNLLIHILKSTFPEVCEDYENSDEDMLGEKLFKCLRYKKYLIVMDDMWSIEAWNDIQRSFPNDCSGSKVVFTSRLPIQSINYVPHILDPLSKSCSWELLEKKVFGMEPCPSELADIGKRIAEKCEGLPLAIVAIAGIMATEDKTHDVWEKIAKNLSSIIAKNQERCIEILELSYNHLPFHLKACFLYIGAQPEDYEFPTSELILLWIAEGFIHHSEGEKRLEAIAEDYLIDLIDRNLIMVARKSHGRIKACHVHDLLRELCLKKAKEDGFLAHFKDDSSSCSAPNKCRRLFIDHQFLHNFSSRPHAQNLRSFLCFPSPKSSYSQVKQDMSFFVKNFELLKVLNCVSVESQGEIRTGELVHLRYLALTLPEQRLEPAPLLFHFLLNLETLILRVSISMDKISLPPHIVKMVNLRHLHTKRGIFEYHVCYDEDNGYMLDSLQTLHRMCICERCLSFLERAPNLRKLGLIGRLDIFYLGDDGLILPDLEFLKCLETLNICGLKKWARVARTRLKLPPTLTQLTLSKTYLKWEELSIILQALSSLEVLKLLKNACSGLVWDTSELEEWSSQLRYLTLEGLDFKEWNATEDQFPRLEVLVIRRCNNLNGIPIEFGYLNELREIKVEFSSPSAEESAREIHEEQINNKGDYECLNLVFSSNSPLDDEPTDATYEAVMDWAIRHFEDASNNKDACKELLREYLEAASRGGVVENEKIVVGLEQEVETLMEMLRDNGDGGCLEIVSIVGMNGMGKTTLAGLVFEHPLMSEEFERRVWVSVSDYHAITKKKLFFNMLEMALQQKCEDYEEISVDKLIEMIYKCLKGRKYLIVLDDIGSIEAWNDIERSLPKEWKGSKVLLTTELELDIQRVNCITYYMGLLPECCTWSLFQAKLFGKEQCPSELVEIGKQIAELSFGVPVFIIATAVALTGLDEDNIVDEWKEFLESARTSKIKSMWVTINPNTKPCDVPEMDSLISDPRIVMQLNAWESARREMRKGCCSESFLHNVLENEKIVIGLEQDVETLMEKLRDNGDGGWLEIVSIVGMNGMGKTTLAELVFEHPLMSQEFESHVWVSVSDYHAITKKKLLFNMLEMALQQKCEDYEEISVDKLIEMIYKCLKGRKYLIVLDDIGSIEAWNDIERSLPKECKGSKVLLTTELELDIQLNSVHCITYYMGLLPECCTWSLFQAKVFGKEQCPSELVERGKQIAELSFGIPVATITMAGGLIELEDKTVDSWNEFFESARPAMVRSMWVTMNPNTKPCDVPEMDSLLSDPRIVMRFNDLQGARREMRKGCCSESLLQ